MLDVADDADNLPGAFLIYGVRVVAEEQLLSDGILVGEEAMRESFVHDNSPRRSFRIVIIQIAPFFQGNLQCAEKIRTDLGVACPRPLVGRRGGMSQNGKGVAFGKMHRKSRG